MLCFAKNTFVSNIEYPNISVIENLFMTTCHVIHVYGVMVLWYNGIFIYNEWPGILSKKIRPKIDF